MKFNKAKLAALAISAFMGTALLGFSAFAEGVTPHDSESQAETTEAVETKADEPVKFVNFKSNGKVTLEWTESGEQFEKDAEVVENVAPTCLEAGHKRFSYQLNGEVLYSEKFEIPALGHSISKDKKTVVAKEATHSLVGDGEGISYTGYYCTRCGVWMTQDGSFTSKKPEEVYAKENSGMTQEVVKVTHKWVPVEIKIIDTDYVELDANDQPVLKDPSIGGRYDIKYFCEIGGETKWHSDEDMYGDYLYLEPEKKFQTIYNVGYENIKGYYYPETRTFIPFLPSNPDPAQIVLIECEKPGKYVELYTARFSMPSKESPANYLSYQYLYTTRDGLTLDAESLIFDQDGNVTGIKGDAISRLGLNSASTKTVDPHHVFTGKVQVASKDANISYTFTEAVDSKTGYGFAAYNNSCVKSGKYTLKYECVSPDDPSKRWVTQSAVTVPANPDAHKIPEGYNKDAIDLAVKYMKAGRMDDANKYWAEVKGYGKDAKGEGYPSSVDEIEKRLENITATCTTTGTGEMVWYCTVCGARVKVETVPVPALGHKIGEKIENRVEPTCGEAGSYDAVQYCVRCGEEYSRKKVIIPATGDHKFGDDFVAWYGKDVVDYNARLTKLTDKQKVDYTHLGQRAVGTFAGEYPHYNQDYVVYANVEHICTVCEQQHVKEYSIHLDIVGDVVKSNKDGYPGSITLRAYAVEEGNLHKVVIEDTKTFNYYTSMDEYTARVVEPPVEPKQEDPKEDDPKPAEPEVKLPAVEGLKAANAGINKIQVSWNAVEGADGYLVLKNGIQVGYTTGATSYLDRNASAEDFSYYWVIPYKKSAAGNVKGELSNYVWAIGRVVGPVAELKAEAAEGSVNLTWSAADGANAYVILSKTDSNKAAFNAPVEVSGTSYTAKAEAGKVQFYWVYAIYNNAEGRRVVAGKVSPFAWAIAE